MRGCEKEEYDSGPFNWILKFHWNMSKFIKSEKIYILLITSQISHKHTSSNDESYTAR